MTRVIHTGDTHLGYRQYHSPERREDYLAAFRQVVDDAIEDEVDAVVHAGDLFHDRRPALSDIHATIGILRDLRAADVPFLAIVGNHERTRGEQWLDLFETLGLATRLGPAPVTVDDVAFYGLDYVPRSKRDDLDYDFEPSDAPHAALVAHGLFTPFNAEWRLEPVLESSPVAFDAVLLGDDHQPDTAQVGDAWVTYCGSTERTSAAEREARGYNLVAFDEGVSIRRRGLETRPFVSVEVELAPGEGLEAVRERVGQEALEDAVVVVSIEGDGEDLPVGRVEEFATERGALVARVTDRREFEDEPAAEIRFADPDEAVRERLRELGLSEAAFAVDETVRGSAADSNVRDRVRSRVSALLDEDPSAFTRAGEVPVDGETPAGRGGEPESDDDGESAPEAGDDEEPTAESEATESTRRAGPGGSAEDPPGAPVSDDAPAGPGETTPGEADPEAAAGPDAMADDRADTVRDDGDDTAREAGDGTDREDGTDVKAEDGDDPTHDDRTDRAGDSTDGQVTMEDYF